MAKALMIVDVQQGMFETPAPLHRGSETVERIAALLRRARAAGLPVIHIRHDGGKDHRLAAGTAGWLHHPLVAPREGETIIDKRFSSAFQDTGLDGHLRRAGIDHLIVAGMQTEMCVDSACRTAAAHGYRITLVEDGHTTWDTEVLPAEKIIAHHNRSLSRSMVTLAKAAEVDVAPAP